MRELTYLWLTCSLAPCGDEPRTYSAMLTPKVLVSDTVCDRSTPVLLPGKLPGLRTDAADTVQHIVHVNL